MVWPSVVLGCNNALENAAYVSTERVMNVLIRQMTELGSGCLTVQILNPSQEWAIIQTRKFCGIDGKMLETDYMDAHFTDVQFTADGLKANLSLLPFMGAGDEETRACTIKILKGQIGDLFCERTK